LFENFFWENCMGAFLLAVSARMMREKVDPARAGGASRPGHESLEQRDRELRPRQRRDFVADAFGALAVARVAQ
jgi:hypothetical protein